jgi:hypothetical protein
MIDAAASAAWSTDKGVVIAGAVVAALREKAIMLPAPATIERAGITGRAKARKRVHDALLTGLGAEQLAALDELLTLDPETGFTRLTTLRTIPSAPKPDHVREIIDKLGVVRAVGIAHDAADRIHPDRLRRLVREGRLSPTYLIDRYTSARRRATVVALLIDLEARLHPRQERPGASVQRDSQGCRPADAYVSRHDRRARHGCRNRCGPDCSAR